MTRWWPSTPCAGEYKLNDINEAYDDMLAGRNIRGVVIHDH
jgi:Zn-dependent alcohol dehydrogenase